MGGRLVVNGDRESGAAFSCFGGDLASRGMGAGSWEVKGRRPSETAVETKDAGCREWKEWMPVQAERESLTDSWQVVCGAGIKWLKLSWIWVWKLGPGTGPVVALHLAGRPLLGLRFWLSRDGYRVATGSRPVRDGGGGGSKGAVGSMSALTRCYPGAISCYPGAIRCDAIHELVVARPCA